MSLLADRLVEVVAEILRDCPGVQVADDIKEILQDDLYARIQTTIDEVVEGR